MADCNSRTYFQRVFSLEVAASVRAWRWERWNTEKGHMQFFDRGQLLLAGRGRERLSHSCSSN